MKNHLLFLISSFIAFIYSPSTIAQSPQSMSYQAVVRDANGNALSNQMVSVRFTIRDGSVGGPTLYQETSNYTTNMFGLFTASIGTGTPVSGAFTGIHWAGGLRYLEVEIDAAGGTNYTLMGTSQLLSVPYALYAENTGGGWSIKGNQGLPDTSFIGTLDSLPLRFKTNNVYAGLIDPHYKSVFLGENAGRNTSYAYGNVAIGNASLTHNFRYSDLVAIGDSALYWNGYDIISFNNAEKNTAVGGKALLNNSTGSVNTAVGYKAGYAITNGVMNTAVGGEALSTGSIGNLNTAVGSYSLTNTWGQYNTACGASSMHENKGGSYNTAVGATALNRNVSGNGATAIGSSAMSGMFATGQTDNTAVGYMALQGGGATFTDNSGVKNTAIGSQSLTKIRAGSSNTAVGHYTLNANSGGNYNTAIGAEALPISTSAGSNTAVGYHAMNSTTTGYSNVAVGQNALNANTTGFYNVAIGQGAYFTTGTLTNTTAIGYAAGGVVNANNRIEIGNTSVSVIAGQVGFSTYSDGRIKNNVRDDVPGLAFINKLRPVTYNLNIHRENEIIYTNGGKQSPEWDGKYELEAVKMTGFIAQEVETAAKECGYDFSGVQRPENPNELYSLRYSDFVMPLVKAVQEQQRTIEELREQIRNLMRIINTR